MGFEPPFAQGPAHVLGGFRIVAHRHEVVPRQLRQVPKVERVDDPRAARRQVGCRGLEGPVSVQSAGHRATSNKGDR